MSERDDFEKEFPLAVWDDSVGGYTEPMYTYAYVGWKHAHSAALRCRDDAYERAAKVCEDMAHTYAEKWAAHGDKESIAHGGATAWDYIQCATAIRALSARSGEGE